jgi:hypothetical protein
MSEPTSVLSIAEAARRLGVEPRKIKQMVRDRQLFTVRSADGKAGIPEEILTKGESGWEPLWNLPGTLTLLADGGFSPEEAIAWLYAPEEELGETPLEALLKGRHHRVNAVAAMLAL